MAKFKIKDMELASEGEKSIYLAEARMPTLLNIRQRFENEKPLKNIVIGACLHITRETAVLARTLKAGGASVALCGSNPLSTQDDVAAVLAKEDFHIYSWRENDAEYYDCIRSVLDYKPDILIDDGADLIGHFADDRDPLPDRHHDRHLHHGVPVDIRVLIFRLPDAL